MAPLLKTLVQLLPSLPGTANAPCQAELPNNHQPSAGDEAQNPITATHASHAQPPHASTSYNNTLSTISWGPNHINVFGRHENGVVHKFWDGHQWRPSASSFESLGIGLATLPVATTWGPNRLDIFGLDDHNVLKHQYWDSTAWQPSVNDFENLGHGCDPAYPIAPSTWGEGRLDIFCTGLDKGDVLHQYYDGSQWQPSGSSLESLGKKLKSGPSVVSWGKNRFDIFGIEHGSGSVVHLYWDGRQWSEWEAFTDLPVALDALSVSSWGENRFDIYGTGVDHNLYHKYWDGSQYSEGWESLGGSVQGSVGSASWSAGRIDLIGLSSTDSSSLYKFFDGHSWQPDVLGWYPKGGTFKSNPSVVTWGENRLDFFAVGAANDALNHQTWYGSGWYPSSTDWEDLGGPLTLVDGESGVGRDRGPAEAELRK